MPARNVLNFDRKITIQTPTTTRGDYGDESTTWSDVATVRAAVSWPNTKSGEEYSADMLVVTKWTVFTIRYREDVTEKDRIEFNGRYFDVITVTEGVKRRQYLIINAQERSTDN